MTDLTKYGIMVARDGIEPLDILDRNGNLTRLVIEYFESGKETVVSDRFFEYFEDLSKWLSINAEAKSAESLSRHLYRGMSFVKGNVIYLVAFSVPNQALMLKGLRNKIEKINILGEENTAVKYKITGRMGHNNMPGIIWIEAKRESVLPYVVKITLKGDPDIYFGSGGPITVNGE